MVPKGLSSPLWAWSSFQDLKKKIKNPEGLCRGKIPGRNERNSSSALLTDTVGPNLRLKGTP